MYSSSDNPNLITDVLCTSNKLCKENPEAVEAVVRGFFDAVEYWKSNPDEANKFMGDKLGVGEEVENVKLPKIYNSGLVTIGECSVIPDGVKVGKNTAISGETTLEDYQDGALVSGGVIIKAGDNV